MNNNKQMQYEDNKINAINVDEINTSENTNDAVSQQEVINKRQKKVRKEKTAADKRLKKGGLVFIASFIAICFLLSHISGASSINTSEEAKLALENHVSTELAIGVQISTEDEYYAGQDLTITHSSPSDETVIHVWDYAAEDGDYVQILVDGVAIGDPFMIMNVPVEYTVPSVGEVQVLGTRDGGGGITYAVHYEVNGTTYFNGTDVGNGNLYTLIRE